jgi:hypothetical protein
MQPPPRTFGQPFDARGNHILFLGRIFLILSWLFGRDNSLDTNLARPGIVSVRGFVVLPVVQPLAVSPRLQGHALLNLKAKIENWLSKIGHWQLKTTVNSQ